jgi:hypothetical protein
MATPLRDTAWLQWIAKLMEPGEPESAPGPGSRGFECRLEDQPDHLVPEYAIRDQERNGLSNLQLFLNPDCWIGINDRMPPEIDRESFDLLCPANENQFTAWVRDPGCGATMPFRLSANLAQLVRIGGDHAFDSRLVRPGTYSALQHCGLWSQIIGRSRAFSNGPRRSAVEEKSFSTRDMSQCAALYTRFISRPCVRTTVQ